MRLGDLHNHVPEYLNAEQVDGEHLRFSRRAVGSDYFPWSELSEMLISIWALVYRPPRASLQMLLNILRFVDSTGGCFNPTHVPASADHFISRMRKRLPLLPVYSRNVAGKNGTLVKAMETPFNLILLRLLSCPRAWRSLERTSVGTSCPKQNWLKIM